MSAIPTLGTYKVLAGAPAEVRVQFWTDNTKTTGTDLTAIGTGTFLAELRPGETYTSAAATWSVDASSAATGLLTFTLDAATVKSLCPDGNRSATFGTDVFETGSGTPLVSWKTEIDAGYTHPTAGATSPSTTTPAGSGEVIGMGTASTLFQSSVITGPQGPQGPAGAAGSGAVSSVNGKTGTVTLAKADVGLGNVDNTSDLTKPISTATQAALDAKPDQADIPVNLTDLGGKLGYQQMGAGAVLTVDFTSSNYNTVARPNVATGVRVWWIGDATTSSSTLPVNAITGDVIDTAS